MVQCSTPHGNGPPVVWMVVFPPLCGVDGGGAATATPTPTTTTFRERDLFLHFCYYNSILYITTTTNNTGNSSSSSNSRNIS